MAPLTMDPVDMAPAGKLTYMDSSHTDHRRPDPTIPVIVRRTATKWYAPCTGRTGELKAERDMPTFKPQRSVDYTLMTSDVEGAVSKPHGVTIGRRALPNGIYATHVTQRCTNPLAPSYSLPDGPSFPHLPSVDKQPVGPRFVKDRSPLDVSDIAGTKPSGIYCRSSKYDNLNYNDVSREVTKTTQMLNSGPRRDPREPININKWPAAKRRGEPTHPLMPAYQQLYKAPDATQAAPMLRAAETPAMYEIEGRMEKLQKHGCGDLAPRTEQEGRRYRRDGLKHINNRVPFSHNTSIDFKLM
mmetsp:Transcript_15485/g.18645  ORF Transcript_15485/g.18645 Transcript_15485/m.18645 type:complete len:300 (+) Transcript_15485:247-1146(+)|eukprot:CAMPEP_0197844018 /NCGR_PEP_ID=MMETSP1438-20131217/983_1 /TAXON_ID=1461541 /ORGANISM="Pterosperma sp., Strain CCMP1384" /LENGTH=299 /DNA_ID=CAMNT_0043454543 /DNA_START=236 /DNA_END=1135 /DNA_ORIENTATION=+